MRRGNGGRSRWRAVVALAVLPLALGACAPGEEAQEPAIDEATVKEEIAAALEEFLPELAAAYSTGEVERIRGLAVERVMAQVEKRIRDLQAQGLVLEPEFDSLVVEELVSFGNDFAIVVSLESWDLRYYSTGSHTLVSEEVDARSRVEYQLKLEEGRWRVFHRELKQDLTE